MLYQNLIISLPTYPKFCWYAAETTHIFHLGLIKIAHLQPSTHTHLNAKCQQASL